jgi:protease I
MAKKVLMVIAPQDFRDEEFFETKEVLDAANLETTVVNSTGEPSRSMAGKVVTPDCSFYDADSADYDAVIFVGGSGASMYFSHNRTMELAKEFFEAKKIVAAICIAPTILANAGILYRKRATAFASEKEKIASVGTFTGKPLEGDGNIITASGPQVSKIFAKYIVEKLK